MYHRVPGVLLTTMSTTTSLLRSRSERSLGRSVLFFVGRYLPSEFAGTAVLLVAALITLDRTGSPLAAAAAGTVAETVGFYSVALAMILVEQRRLAGGGIGRMLGRTVGLGIAEFGPIELLDTLLARPALLYLGTAVLPNPVIGLLAGKLAADVLFYVGAASAYRVTDLAGWRGSRTPSREAAAATSVRDAAPAGTIGPEMREVRRRELAARFSRETAQQLADAHDGPVLLLDVETARRRYAALREALPFARLHYAVKALDHPAVVEALAADGGWFDIASQAELRRLTEAGISGDRMIFSNPIATGADRAAAVAAGVRTFVVDNETELLKTRALPADCRVLVRLAYRNPEAHIDLSAKFGADRRTAERLVALGVSQGLRVAGFSFHVGSQLNAVEPFRQAIRATAELMTVLERRHDIRFDTLDIGGGFPASYREATLSAPEIAAAIRPLLEPLAARMTILAEPGRSIVADSMVAVARVVGVADRPDGRWYYLNDGVYGSYSNVMTEQVHPLLIAASELDDEARWPEWVTLAGPTCDSADVIAHRYPMPPLAVGDVVLSPTMGAYTAVTACRFNGRPPAEIVLVDSLVATR